MPRWLLPVLASLALAGCGSSSKSTSSVTAKPASSTPAGSAGDVTATSVADAPANPVPRQVILTAEIDVATPDVAAAAGKARTIATNAGGELFGEDSISGDHATRHSR